MRWTHGARNLQRNESSAPLRNDACFFDVPRLGSRKTDISRSKPSNIGTPRTPLQRLGLSTARHRCLHANDTGSKTSTEVSLGDLVHLRFHVPCPMPDILLHRCVVHGTRESDGASIFSSVCSCLLRMPSCPESARNRTNTWKTFLLSLPTSSPAFSSLLSRGPRNQNGERSRAAFERQRSVLRIMFAAKGTKDPELLRIGNKPVWHNRTLQDCGQYAER